MFFIAYELLRNLGLNASLKPSPQRLKARTTTRIVSPGINVSQGASKINRFPSDKIFPQVAKGGGTPKPKKLRADSVNIALATPIVADTRAGAIAFGVI